MKINDAPTPKFRRILEEIDRGTVLKPLLQSYLDSGDWRGITLHVDGQDPHDLAHGPDGWFHPSSHPLLPERRLFYYLDQPGMMIPEPMDWRGKLTVTMGKVAHLFIQECLDDLGLMVRPTRSHPEEPQVEDPEVGSRGHYDGETKVLIRTHPDDVHQLFEFKTMSPLAKLLDDLDLDGFKKKYPGYYAQVQEYMRMSGLRLAIVIMLQMGYPWEMREFHIPYDPAWSLSVRDKYLSVREAVRSGELPPPCCAPKSSESKLCPARSVCPVAQ